MTLTEILMVLAIFLAPMIAIRTEKWLELKRQETEDKKRIFRVLMSTRASRLSSAHVEALNLIDVIFTDKKERSVREKWKQYLDKLGSAPEYPQEKTDPNNPNIKKIDDAELTRYNTDIKIWNDSCDDLVAELLQEMGKTLGYEFDIVHIKKGGYIPKGLTDDEQDTRLLRRAFLKVLLGQLPVSMDVKSFPGPSEEEVSEQKVLRKLLIDNLRGDTPLQIIVKSESNISS